MWKSEEDKLIKSGRKWEESPDFLPYRYAHLFCEECGKPLGRFDIVCTNLETHIYCDDCVKKFIKQTPIALNCGTITKDLGWSVTLQYEDSYYSTLAVEKVCYFNKKGRYIKVKGKRYYVS